MKKYLSVVLTLALILSLAAFAMPTAFAADDDDFHIGIITGSVSQDENDYRGAEAFAKQFGEDKVKIAVYPDNFSEELETTIQTIVNMSDDPKMKAIIVNQAVPAPPRPSARSKSVALTFSASPAKATRTCPRSAALPTWSATTTSLPAAI